MIQHAWNRAAAAAGFASVLIASAPAAQIGPELAVLPQAAGHSLSDGAPMPVGTEMQLGLFTGGFVPTAANVASWAANWQSVGVWSYQTTELGGVTYGGMSGSLVVQNNLAPFEMGNPLYVWVSKEISNSASEWLLAADANWKMPDAGNLLGFPVVLNVAKASTYVVGSGNPATEAVQTAAVTGAAGPKIQFSRWRWQFFNNPAAFQNDAVSGPSADPDGDRIRNKAEYAAGSNPLKSSASLLNLQPDQGGGLKLEIPWSAHAEATSVLHVSQNLQFWMLESAAEQTDKARGIRFWQLPLSTQQRFWRWEVD